MFEEYDSSHPALKNFSPMWETVKNVARKAIKWAAIGAIAGAIAFAIVPGIGGAIVSGLGGLFSGIFGGGGAAMGVFSSAVTSAAVPGLLLGAAAGAVLGGLSGLAGSGEKVADVADMRIDAYDRKMIRQQQQLAMNVNLANQGLGTDIMSPGGLPMERAEGRSV